MLQQSRRRALRETLIEHTQLQPEEITDRLLDRWERRLRDAQQWHDNVMEARAVVSPPYSNIQLASHSSLI